jgi:hypothetical protein
MMPGVADVEGLRRSGIKLALLLGAPVLAWMAAQWIVGENATTLVAVALAAIVVIVGVNILNDWRFGLLLSIAWMVFEDLPRKYLGNNMTIYFGKDFLIAITYVSFLFALRRREASTFRPPFILPLSLFFWFALAQVFNPNSPSIFYGLLGIKLYFYYVPLMFVGYALLRNEEDLRRVLVWNLALGGVISLFGILQAIVGPDFLNPVRMAPEIAQLSHVYRAAPISGVRLLRPVSVFVSDGRFAFFLELMWILGLGSAGFLMARMQRGRRYVLLGLSLVAGAILLSGVRGAFVYGIATAILLAPSFLRGAPAAERMGWRKVMSAVRWVSVLVGITLVALAYYFPSEVGARWAFYTETLSPDSPAYEVTRRAWDYPVSEFMKAFDTGHVLLGHGVGTASLGVFYASKFFNAPLPGIGVESGFGNILLEFGLLGPLMWLVWSGALLYYLWKVVRRLRGTPFDPLGNAIFWFVLLILLPFTYGSLTTYQNFVNNAYLWLLVGVLFRLPELAAPYQATPPALGNTFGQ